jgi:hypothetical protein
MMVYFRFPHKKTEGVNILDMSDARREKYCPHGLNATSGSWSSIMDIVCE